MTRQERVEELIRQEVCEILREKVSDPRIGFASVTGVEVSPDLENASIYVSILGDEKKKRKRCRGSIRPPDLSGVSSATAWNCAWSPRSAFTATIRSNAAAASSA